MKHISAPLLSAEEFYDITSEFYEQMIDFEKNLRLRIDAYRNIFVNTGKVADLGCGIGLDSIALAKNGHAVTAFDISPRMIKTANNNKQRHNVNVDFRIGSIVNLPSKYHGKFNSVVCMGNTISHLNQKELHQAFINFYELLTPEGKLFVHILNYDKIIKSNKRINNIANREGKTIIRFYDFFENFIRFNILACETADAKKYQLITTKQYPHSKKEIILGLKKVGFKKIKCYGNFTRQNYISSESKDLFIEATK
jgi:2-polyprenyl-3-methyl-5-hydroxy-6-metoxy-1,4-benzoquinol methylase